MGGGHHDFHGPPEVPDYKIYKVEDCPELVNIQRKLAKKGLKDPWLRNEVWRYAKAGEKPWTTWSTLKHIYFPGFKYGLAAFVLTVIGEKVYHHYYPKEDAHGHGH